jgi:hypothetical protein
MFFYFEDNGSMDERGGAGGFARLAAAAMCDHAVL